MARKDETDLTRYDWTKATRGKYTEKASRSLGLAVVDSKLTESRQPRMLPEAFMSSHFPNAVTGVLRGNTITLDVPVPPLDGHRVRVTVEPAGDDELALSATENDALLREWAAHGPQGPIEDNEDFPSDE